MLLIRKPLATVTSYLDITCNSLIFLDLDLTIRNPFYPRIKRVKYFVMIVLFVLGFVSYTFVKGYSSFGSVNFNLFEWTKEKEVIRELRYFVCALLLLTIIPFIRVMLRLCNKGTSKDLRQKVLKRHLTHFILFTAVIL